MGNEMKYYLAGPMSGLPQSNFPAFYDAAETLRAEGYTIISPAELDIAEEVANALAGRKSKSTWGDFLSRDVKIVVDGCDGIIFLPGWAQSRGARLEAFTALLSGKTKFGYFFADGACKVSWAPVGLIREVLTENMP